MLLGVEKKRKEEEGLDSNFSLRSQASDVDDGGVLFSVFCLGFCLFFWKIVCRECCSGGLFG